jgi:hypothetical protein
MARILARFVFTLLILSGFLFYEGYVELQRPGRADGWRVGLYFLAGGIGLGLAMRGLKERHRPRGDQ